MVGGLLSNPAEKYPTVFGEDGLFGHFPYLLPCLISVSLSIVGISSGYFYLEETLKKKHNKLISEEQIELNETKKEEKNGTALELIEDDENNTHKEDDLDDAKTLDVKLVKDENVILNLEDSIVLDDINLEMKEKKCCNSNPFKKAYLKVCGPQTILSKQVIVVLTQFGLLVLNINMFDETFSLLMHVELWKFRFLYRQKKLTNQLSALIRGN